MNILINKSGRRVKLTKREQDLLSGSKALLAEIANSAGGEAAESAVEAVEAIGKTQEALLPVEVTT